MFKWLFPLFGKRASVLSETDTMKKFLIVGLGNIGPKYANTRHNVGFKILDTLAEEEGLTFETAKLGDIAVFKYKGRQALCLKPSTYMNLSGKAVRYWMEKENIPLENVLVITDDINLPFGTLRLKMKGSDGGHNGLKDIQSTLQTTRYNRFRFGVGSEFGKGQQVDYVLGEWNDEENERLPERLKRATELVRSFIFAGTKNTMNIFNNT
ncbi:MAG: aminoacyl-tRNA hydrolase [Muricauda sp.]|uniref:Peptidyl-tRNA hydrolase n=1 Tax=Flagellimonas lutaonensis TaxID=516051 RepID=A0A0D5YTT6_9FLAO|nr:MULTISPECIES: aminoacyl-tRNA hydrolase [Allomuricauda]AKA35309.1 Peptidyl-tRNA hydrolase [Allomuricauda lutaonensis]MBC29601.1 aminoacyl-tRNA hydrolase [Allomuricauda sp.]|tara:strand:+ start:25369 stop:25998 length:630 start_codon:yes stop_codon:yes gene_type:complete